MKLRQRLRLQRRPRSSRPRGRRPFTAPPAVIPGLNRFVFAAAYVGAAALVSTTLLRPVLGASAPFLVYFPAVTAAGWYGGFGPALLATVLSAACVRLFAMEPGASLLDPVIAGRLAVFLASGTFVAYLTHRMHLLVDEARRGEERFRTFAEVAPVFVWKLDDQGRLTYINERFAEYTGLPLESLLAMGWEAVIHPDDLPRVRELWSRVFRERRPTVEVECRVRGADGAYRWTLARGVRISEDGQDGYLGATLDIDDRKRGTEALERAVSERTDQLQQALSELRAFSHTVSHNLRAPLRSMQGFAHIVVEQEAGRLDPASQDLLKRIEAAAARMDLLVRDFLAFADIVDAPARLRPLDLDEFVADVLQSHPRLAASDVRVCFPLGRVEANEALLMQALLNILVNAVSFVPDGRRPLVKIWTQKRADALRLWVEDNGEGIDSAMLPRLFEAFITGDARSRRGTGMGLAIAKKAVEKMGGRIGVESEADKGSRFWVELSHG